MRERLASLSCLFLFAVACQGVPPPSDGGGDDVRQRCTQLEATVHELLAKLAAPAPAPESPSTAELAARIATLTESIDDLAVRLPAALPASSAANTRPADAVAAKSEPARTACVLALQRAIEVCDRERALHVENLANVATPGFRRRALRTAVELDAATGLQLPRARGVELCTNPGCIHITERNLDLAIDGSGWFQVADASGELRYTRDGRFQVAPDGHLVTTTGEALTPLLELPNDTLEIAIDPSGRVLVRTASAVDASRQIGRIQLADVPAAVRLEPSNGTLVRATDGPPVKACEPGTVGLGLLKQGMLEGANVVTIEELVALQQVERRRALLVRTLASMGVFVR